MEPEIASSKEQERLAMTGYDDVYKKSPGAFALGDLVLTLLFVNQQSFAQRYGDRYCHYYWRRSDDFYT